MVVSQFILRENVKCFYLKRNSETYPLGAPRVIMMTSRVEALMLLVHVAIYALPAVAYVADIPPRTEECYIEEVYICQLCLF